MELIRLGKLGRGMPVVVPGPEPEVPKDARCALCKDDSQLQYVVVGHKDTVVCLDSMSCVKRALGVES
jgi:hypothetical protein